MKMMRYFVRLFVSVLVLACYGVSASALDKSFYAETSKLASGKWVRIAVKESGIYQITADDIRNWGLGTDLSTIHVFGYGGAPLSEVMLGDNYADDLPQMPVVRSADRILFYAQGPTTWRRLNSTIPQFQVQHPYAISGSYFVTNDSRFNDNEIARASNQPTGEVITSYIDRQYHEQEIINPGETGREFLGESFLTNRTQTFKFDLNGRVDGSDVTFTSAFGVRSPNHQSTISFSCNGKAMSVTNSDIIEASGTSSHVHYNYSRSIKTYKPDEPASDLNIAVNYACGGMAYLARMDYITVNFERNLALRNGRLLFGLDDALTSARYRLSGSGSATHVWDVTAPFAPMELNTTAGEGSITFSPATAGRREFVAFDEAATYSHPEFIGNVANQNIHGEPTPDMIILAPSAYLEQARRVAALHEQVDSFRVLVLDHEKVFNEFSSGTQDAMAYRRLCKMFYDRGTSDDGHRLAYLLLFGSGSYDNRLVGTDAGILNYPRLLTWQSDYGRLEDNTFTTDDFFAVLGDESGVDSNERMDIAVGRMLAKNVSEARTVVNKLIKYVTSPIYGSWKNQVMFVADDENKGVHMNQSLAMDQMINKNGGKDMMRSYVFIDAFEAVSEGGARTYPDARTKMFNTLTEGTLWWNYIGHSSTQNWTGEGLLKRSDVESNLFYKRLPVLYAATCEFLRFDNSVTSSGELVYGNANGGAIAVICPPRLALIDENGTLSSNVAQFIFSRDEAGLQRRIGDIMRLAKNSIIWSSGDNKRRFFVYGDPAMRLAYAPYEAQVETINGKPVDPDNMPVFKARETVEFSGKIVDIDGKPVDDFNGNIVSTLFGPEQSITTHGYYSGSDVIEGVKVTYEDRPNRLAINVDSVSGGRFNVRIIIPSEVNNEYDNYRPSLINLYAYDTHKALEAKGSNSDFLIYGYNDEEVTDTIGPSIINMGLNDEHFVDGSDVNESPLFMATVADDSGVNFSSAGIGHSMTLTLDGITGYNDVASYYTPMFVEQGTLGTINYQLSDLTPGLHNLRLRVWDVYNNVSDKTITFNVVNGLAPEIADVYCAANPASAETSFYVKHNRPDAVVSVTIEVFDLMGRRVWSTTQSGRSDMYTSIPVTWDLVDVSGRRVPRGIYVYRATITTDGIKQATKAKKLAVASE